MRSILRMFPNLEALSRAAAGTFLQSAATAIEARGRFLAAISGGNTPTGMYALLADPTMHRQVDWTRIFLFWTDERCVPPERPGSNYGEVHRVLLQHVPIPEGNVLRVRGELPPAKAAADYARMLLSFATPPWEWPQFDLVLLGLGEDGHIASLFPGSPVEARTPTLAVTANYQDRPAQRVTLTPLVFNTARQIVFMVSGMSKAHGACQRPGR